MSSIKEFEHLRIPLQVIKFATDNFSDNNYISRGGFGKVYKGELLHFGGHVTVAVKRLDSTLGQGTPEFWKEIMMLSRYRHEHLMRHDFKKEKKLKCHGEVEEGVPFGDMSDEELKVDDGK
ncbi:hypothetical protein L6452_17867 [Arctium lappa]|uniref:Uncharacterized protein n=1 Tax=Arctium lappa TaxID=4217 RepID=A0ACB9C4J2_ARCLA|nr:hypothetical protein L6452_17867 [Arctium lappa]